MSAAITFFSRLDFRAVLVSQQNWAEHTEGSHVPPPLTQLQPPHCQRLTPSYNSWTQTDLSFSLHIHRLHWIHAWCCVFYGIWQKYNLSTSEPLLWYLREWFHCSKWPLCSTNLSLPPLNPWELLIFLLNLQFFLIQNVAQLELCSI